MSFIDRSEEGRAQLENAWVRPYTLTVLLQERAKMPEPLQGPFVDAISTAERALQGGATVTEVMDRFDEDIATVRDRKVQDEESERALRWLKFMRDHVAAFLSTHYPVL